jgi:hypothetical protein
MPALVTRDVGTVSDQIQVTQPEQEEFRVTLGDLDIDIERFGEARRQFVRWHLFDQHPEHPRARGVQAKCVTGSRVKEKPVFAER